MEDQNKSASSDLLKQNESSWASQSSRFSAFPSPGIKDNPAPSSIIGGPRFNVSGRKNRLREWAGKYGSSVVLPIVALLILAGGIYLYANQKSEETKLILTDQKAGVQQNLAGIAEQTPPENNLIAAPDGNQDKINEIIPENKNQNETIVEKAAKGEGVTHLARKALRDYLEANPKELTNEHKIYIEDYLKDQIGSRPLEIDEEISFSEDLIQEAIDASLGLNEGQLKNLEQYSVLVAW